VIAWWFSKEVVFSNGSQLVCRDAEAKMNYRLGNDNPSGGDFVLLMTKNLMRKAIRLPWATFQSMHSDFLINTLGLDMGIANKNLDLLMSGIAAALDLVAVLFTMTLFSPVLAMCIILALPVIVLYNKSQAKEVAVWAEKLNESQKRNEAHTQEIVTHVQHIKLLGVGPGLWRKLLAINDSLKVAFDTFDEKHTGNIRGLAFLSMVTTIITIAFGTVQVILGQLTMGKLLGFLQLAQNVDAPIEQPTSAIVGVIASKPAMNHIVGLLEAEEEGPGDLPPRSGVLALNQVMYDYEVAGFSQAMGPYQSGD
jgi:ABC-type bacteriocin/lantibiotic exporter with double-glycine peptidase domain